MAGNESSPPMTTQAAAGGATAISIGKLAEVIGGDTGGFAGVGRRIADGRERSNENWAQLKNIAA